MNAETVSIFWFRRDLRLHDNAALYHALAVNKNVIPLFIFDTQIIDELEPHDRRLQFIYASLKEINSQLSIIGSSVLIKKGVPLDIFNELTSEFQIKNIYLNTDYEPYAIKRDAEINKFARLNGIGFYSFKDHVVFEKNEILKNDGSPYTVFTPYARRWLDKLAQTRINEYHSEKLINNLYLKKVFEFPSLEQLGFKPISFLFPSKVINTKLLTDYEKTRDNPAIDGTTRLGLHLRFGTISIRKAVSLAISFSEVWLKELIWREFFMMILSHFPYVQTSSFKKKYNNIEWLNNAEHFERWCKGNTGFPLVDAGMRELNETGFMHNRLRMITASFLVKHLLIDWQWGESYFAGKLLDYELSSNNGNWQWAAGTGCDAAPYFRVFNPAVQTVKFDKNLIYINKWVPELKSNQYSTPIVNHEMARKRCVEVYRKAIQ